MPTNPKNDTSITLMTRAQHALADALACDEFVKCNQPMIRSWSIKCVLEEQVRIFEENRS
jgi:hypothetical protein